MPDLCDEFGIKPNQIYAWQKILFDHAETAFQQAGVRARPARYPPKRRKSYGLEDKLHEKERSLRRVDGGERHEKKANGEL